MEDMCYPRITEHKKFHKRCSDFIMGLDLPKLKAEPVERLEKIRDEVQAWIMNHVLSEDCNMTAAYKKYLKEQADRAGRVEIPVEERYGRFLKEYDVVRLYLYKNQENKGHMVAVFKEAAKEMCRLSTLERNLFFADIAKAANVLRKCYQPDAICYMDLEDMDDKLIFHIIPKYKDAENYGAQTVINMDAGDASDGYDAIYEALMKVL